MTARLLTIMGSGETSPTMVKVHRDLIDRVGPPPVPAVLLDTPFGFQENADDLTARAQRYFRESVGVEVGVASLRDVPTDPVVEATAVARVRAARYVFAGPGSPTYALGVWSGSGVPAALVDALRPGGTGGAVTFASAAALTLGVATIPVYEIYKAGEAPSWRPGLDVLGQVTGISAAVVPHYDNAEGGGHDTRFCYLGERRLAPMEEALPAGAFVLGVDEHTGLVLDLDAGSAVVVGRGTVTVRSGGRSEVLPAGCELRIADLQRIADGLASGGEVARAATDGFGSGAGEEPATGAATADATGPAEDPLVQASGEHERAFAAALSERDPVAAARAVLALEADLEAWASDPTQGDQRDRAREVLRSMVVRLAELAEGGARDPRELVGPFVEALLDQRVAAREEKRWADADAVRDRLTALGVEVRDGPSGTEWDLAAKPG